MGLWELASLKFAGQAGRLELLAKAEGLVLILKAEFLPHLGTSGFSSKAFNVSWMRLTRIWKVICFDSKSTDLNANHF